MKTKLTLSIEKEVVERAKKFAKESDQTISEMVEGFLRAISRNQSQPAELSDRLRSLAGKFRLPEGKEDRDVLVEELTKKYL